MGFNQNFVNRVSGRHLIVTLLMFYATFLLAACDKKGADGSGEVKAGQSIVRVNGDEITIHQLNLEMQRANIQPAQQEVAGKQIAKSLVDRQILVQEAVKSKLDRNPNVMQAIESAKAQILAQAYLESKVPSTPPTEAEVVAYRTQHPEIFANRKVYVMDEASFVVDAANTQSVQSLSQVAKTVEDVTAWLDSHQIKFTRNTAAHAAETVPELLEKFSKMVVGDLIFINGNGRTLVGRMVEIKDMPISDADAKPLVERILTNEKRKKSAEAEMARLRATAQIEYLNKKFEPSTAAKSAAVVEPDSTVKSIDQATSSAAQDKSLEKGLSGL